MKFISFISIHMEKINLHTECSIKYKKRHLLVIAKLQGQLLLDKSISH